MGGLQMRLMILACALLAIFQLAGCDSPPRENKLVEVERPSQARPPNQDLLSVGGELFPLSAYYGVCVRYKGIWKAELRNGMLGPHFPTDGDIVLADGGKLTVSVGKLGMYPGTVLKDIPATSLPRRIQIGRDRFHSFVVVSDFEKAGNNLVIIDYDATKADARDAAIRLANSVVACHVSAAT
jgi:hypothetical protein